jgi:hypothetical protein
MECSAFIPAFRRGRQGPRRSLHGRRSVVGCEPLERRDCPAALFTIEPPTGPIIEGDRATFTVRLAAPSSQPERLLVSTVAESATLGRDYVFQNNQQLLFTPGTTTRQFTINTLSDSLRENVETLRIVVTPTNRPGAQPVTTRASIYDLVPTSVSVGDIRVTEGNEGTTNANFTVRLTAGAILPVTLQYATRNGTATAGTDYTATTGTLTFAPGEFVKTVSVPILGDRIAEVDETFQLVLSNPSRGTTLRTPQATCTIVNDEQDQLGFQVALKFLDSASGPVPQSVRTVAEQAVNRWARIITGDLASVTENGIFIDDFEMSIQMGLLGGAPQGPGGILANATPTAFRDNGNGLPYAGITGLDPADIGNPALLLDIIAHEMGHAFGFTPGANVFSRWIVGETFVGANALREYNSIFTTTATGVPLQAGVRAHWDETIFGNELMTPGANSTNFISRITVGALQDMGYTVNYAAAEPYVRPSSMTPQVAAATGVATVSAFTPSSTPVVKPSQAAVPPKPSADAAPQSAKPAVQPPKPAATTTQPTARPTTPRSRPLAPVTAGGVAAAFSTLGRLS